MFETVASNKMELKAKFAELMGEELKPEGSTQTPPPRTKQRAARLLDSAGQPATCPSCKAGNQVVRKSSNFFIACDRFPKCRFTKKIESQGVSTEDGLIKNDA